MHFERNMKLMAEYQPEVFKKLKSPELDLSFPDVQILFGTNENNVTDNVLIKCNEMLYIVGNEQESEAWVNNVNPDLHTIVVLGFGMGYHIEKLAEKYPDKKIIVVEPDKRVLDHVLHVRSIEKAIKSCTIYLDESTGLVRAKLHEMITHPLARGIMLIPFYQVVYQQYVDEIIDLMKRIMNDWAVMVNTKRCLVNRWYENRVANAKCPSFNANGLIGKFKDVPALLVGAGPSLKSQLDTIRSLQGKAVIVAASTAIQILFNHGIKPTFMVAIDQDPITSGGLHEYLDSDIPLIFDGQIAQNSLSYKGKKLQMLLNVNVYTGMVIKDLPVFESGPSVANVCLDILHKMGCGPILVCGMDLSYTDNMLYCDGTKFNQEIKEKNLIQIVNNKGETCSTEPSFISMRNWFEEYTARIKPNVFNCTECGLVISGMENKALTDFPFDREYDFDSINACELITEIESNKGIYDEIVANKTFINTNKLVTLEIQKCKTWPLVEEFSQSRIYLEEIRCEDRIKKGVSAKEAIKTFQENRLNIILESMDSLINILK